MQAGASERTWLPGRGAIVVILFNMALALWLLLKPGSHGVFQAVDNVAQFVGPLLMLPLCFGDLWRRQRGKERGTRSRRWAPIMLGCGLLGISVGQMIFTWYEQVLHYAAAPFPSWADACWLSVYPFLLFGILLLPTQPLPLASRTRVALDGVMIMTAIVTFSWYFILGPTILEGADSLFAQIVGAAYPVCDLVLVCCLLVLAAHVSDPRLRRVVYLLQIALGIIVVTDSLLDYLELHNAYHTGGLLDLGWPLGYMLVGLAAGHLRRATAASSVGPQKAPGAAAPVPPRVWRALLPYAVVPAVGVLACYAWRMNDAVSLDLGVYLGGAILIALVLLRQVFALLENRRLMAETVAYAHHMEHLNQELQATHSELAANNAELQGMHGVLAANNAELQAMHDELSTNNQALREANLRLEALATTDPMTGLCNHRAMVAALEHELERARRYGRPCAVLFLDLDHFKALNDSYGHAAGDATLHELARVVKTALRGVDIVGRWGGEEFVVLLPETTATGALELAERVRVAVAAHAFSAGGGTHLTCSIGLASHPHDAEERDRLIDLADRAMYAAKRLGRNQVCRADDPVVAALLAETSAGGSREEAALAGTVEALAALVEARDNYTGRHTQEVATLTLRLALALGLDATEAHMIGLAARLHDVGKIGVPDAVLQKAARLTEQEWIMMRAHPGVGADVVGHVPALRALAPVIRAHHERWDGQGYPDGLAGEAIPLGARIIGVADAYGAMTSDRPYRQARTADWAIGEIQRCAGAQFDPAVVAALEQVLAAGSRPADHTPAPTMLPTLRNKAS